MIHIEKNNNIAYCGKETTEFGDFISEIECVECLKPMIGLSVINTKQINMRYLKIFSIIKRIKKLCVL